MTKIVNEVENFVNKSPAKKKQSPVQMAHIPESIKKKSDQELQEMAGKDDSILMEEICTSKRQYIYFIFVRAWA